MPPRINAHVLSLYPDNIVTPEVTPRHAATVQGFGNTSLQHQEDLAEPSVAPTAMQPVILGMAPVFFPLLLPRPQVAMYSQTISLQQEAPQGHLAVAARAGTSRTHRMKKAKSSGKPTQQTSVMLRNIPLDLTRDMFQEMLDREGFMGTYDLIYLPRDFKTGANLGYAFVNLLAHAEGVRMQNHFTGFCRWSCRSGKKCEVAWSSQQGLAEYVDRYRNNPIMHKSVPEHFKPALFQHGLQVEFPAPTRALKPPQERLQVL
jgi:hypothetical protein